MESDENSVTERSEHMRPSAPHNPLHTPVYPAPSKGIGAPAPDLSITEVPQQAPAFSVSPTADLPIPVVKVLSVRGVEYFMMTITLWALAASLIWALLAMFNGQGSFAILAFPISLMLVGLPVFAFFFLRLRRAELANPVLRLDASKRRLSQVTQVIAFITCLSNLVTFVYMLLSKIGGESPVSIGKAFLNLLVVLLIAGGILAYYWFDEHRINRG